MRRLLLSLLVLGQSCSWFDTEPEPRAKERKPMKAEPRSERARPPVPAGQPNVLLVVWDTVRADRLSMYGYSKPTMPRMEAWARAEAVVHERAVSPGVWTLPSHASLFTALPVRSHGVDAPTPRLDDRFTPFAEVLRDQGFDTYTFCANPYLMKSTRLLRGFDEQDRPWTAPWKGRIEAALQARLDPRDASTPLSPGWRGDGGGNKYLFKDAGPVAAEALTRWLQGREEPTRPWFAFLNYMEAHLPRVPSLAARKAVMSDDLIEHAWTVPQTTEHFHDWMAGTRSYSARDLEAISGVYDASLVDLDAATADLLERLQAIGAMDNTIVIITSDHGELLGEHGLMLHKYSVHQELSRVPLMISWKGHLPPGRDPAPISVADVLPRVASLGGIRLPDEVGRALSSRPASAHPGVVTEFNAVDPGSLEKLRKRYPQADLSRFERTWIGMELGPHKLLQGAGGVEEMYHVLADPGERKPISDEAVLTPMRDALDAWRVAVPVHVAAPAPAGQGAMDPELERGLEALGYLQ